MHGTGRPNLRERACPVPVWPTSFRRSLPWRRLPWWSLPWRSAGCRPSSRTSMPLRKCATAAASTKGLSPSRSTPASCCASESNGASSARGRPSPAASSKRAPGKRRATPTLATTPGRSSASPFARFRISPGSTASWPGFRASTQRSPRGGLRRRVPCSSCPWRRRRRKRVGCVSRPGAAAPVWPRLFVWRGRRRGRRWTNGYRSRTEAWRQR